VRPIERAVGKLEEAQRSLVRLAGTWDDADAAGLCSAFLTAARSTTFVLQACLADRDGFSAWWSQQRESLAADPVARYLLDARNEVEKLGVRPLHYRGVATGRSLRGVPHCRRFYAFVPLEKAAVAPPAGDAVHLAQAHVNRLAELLDAAVDRFLPESHQLLRQRLESLRSARPPKPAVCPLHRTRARHSKRRITTRCT
jgi:hypothetical protein